MSPRRGTAPPPGFGWRQAGALLFWLVLLAVLFGLACGRGAAGWLGVGYWPGVAAAAAAFVLGLPVLFVVMVALLVLYRTRRLRSEASEFALARKVAPTEGAVVRFAEVTAWVAEPDDHPPLLRAALEAARAGSAALLPDLRGEQAAGLRVLCFESKREMEAYARNYNLVLEAMDGVYVHARPPRLLTHAEVVPRRPVDAARLQRLLFAHYFLRRAKGFLLPPWLGTAVAQVVAGPGERGALGRLHRKVRALLARSGGEGEDWVFRARGLQMAGWLRAWRDFDTYTGLTRLFAYGRSLGEFLGGELATAERRDRFRAYVTELGRRDDPERLFARHFGHGFDRLLADWRQAVEAFDGGEHEPPPAYVREALLNRVLPLVEDADADPWERTRAMRDLSEAGYLLGADALIHVLEDEGPALRREAASALELISGTAGGEDVRHWWEWWHRLPSAAVPVRDTAVRERRGPRPPATPD